MPRIKVRTFSGAICEQEVFNVPDSVKNLTSAIPRPRVRFETDEDRMQHKSEMSRRHHARIVNENFSPTSIYSTLTFDDEHEVHTFKEARRTRDLYIRRLQHANPKAQIIIYMGRGKGTSRIHFHMLSNGLSEETITEKWKQGAIVHMKHLKKRCFYDGVDHGQDYTSLANYLFNHWTPEQGAGTHRWRPTKNIRQPEREEPTIAKRNYSENKPPLAPKGYRYIGFSGNDFGYLHFLYTRI